MIIAVLSFFILCLSVSFFASSDSSATNEKQSSDPVCHCSDILEHGVKGEWIRGHQSEISRFHAQSDVSDSEIRRVLLLPKDTHRSDLRCGWGQPLLNSTLPSGCDPDSYHYCCSEKTGWCGNTTKHCTYEESTDYKQLVPSNQAIWKESSSDCKLINFSRKGACDLLSENQINLIFMGDSEARKFLTAFLLFLTGDFSKGVLHKDASIDERRRCNWDLQLLNDDCNSMRHDSSLLLDDPAACGYTNAFLVEYFPDYNTFFTSHTAGRIKSLLGVKNTYIILNSGAHFSAISKSFLDYYLKYIVPLVQDKNWPQLIVETLPRTPSVTLSNQRASFRDAVRDFCIKNKIPVFDNFDLSKNMKPYDGKHFRLPYYLQKIKILLNYLKVKVDSC